MGRKGCGDVQEMRGMDYDPGRMNDNFRVGGALEEGRKGGRKHNNRWAGARKKKSMGPGRERVGYLYLSGRVLPRGTSQLELESGPMEVQGLGQHAG